MKFDEHISNICLTAYRKLSALTILSRFISLELNDVLYSKPSFLESQFSYCPLVWIFYRRKTNHKINRIHERAFRIVYNDYVSSFQDFLIPYFTIKASNLWKTKFIRLKWFPWRNLWRSLSAKNRQLFSPFRTRINHFKSEHCLETEKFTQIF